MEIEYDPAKDAINRRKHGISLGEASHFDWDMAEIVEDARYDYGEQRFKATGMIGSDVYVAIYCDREGATRVISLRKAEKYEVRNYVHYLEQR